MKFSKWYLIALAVVSCSSVAFADERFIDGRNLTPEQLNQLKIQALQMQNAPTNTTSVLDTVTKVSATTRSEAEKWSDLGRNLGSAMVSTAKELGVAVVDFSKTDLGRIATFIIVYKLIGHDLMHLIVGFLLFFTWPWLIIAARHYMVVRGVKYTYEDRKFWGIPYRKKLVTQITKIDGDDAAWIFFLTCVATAVGLWVAIAIIL